MTHCCGVLHQNLERVTKDKVVVFKLELEYSLILAKEIDGALVLLFIWGVNYSVNKSVRHIIVLCV